MSAEENFDCGLDEQEVSEVVAGARSGAPVPSTPPKRARGVLYQSAYRVTPGNCTVAMEDICPPDFPPIFGDAT